MKKSKRLALLDKAATEAILAYFAAVVFDTSAISDSARVALKVLQETRNIRFTDRALVS